MIFWGESSAMLQINYSCKEKKTQVLRAGHEWTAVTELHSHKEVTALKKKKKLLKKK